VDAPAGTVQWSHRSQTALGDLFALQDDLTRQIVSSLAVPLSGDEERALQQDVPASPGAYESYLRATQFGRNNETTRQARDLYLQCLEEDPTYAPAWARLGRVYRRLGNWGDRAQASDNYAKAEDALRRALDLNPDLSLAHHYYAYLELDLGRAQEAMLRLLAGVKRHRADPELLAGLLHALRYCGLLEASVAAFEKAERLDPNVTTSVSHTFWMLRDTHRAVETETDGDRMMSMLAALRNDQTDVAIAQLRRRAAKASGAALVNTSTLIAVLEKDVEGFAGPFDALVASTRDPENLYYSSLMAAYVGDVERCLSTLERTVGGGWFCYETIAGEPWLAGVRDTPRLRRWWRKPRRGACGPPQRSGTRAARSSLVSNLRRGCAPNPTGRSAAHSRFRASCRVGRLRSRRRRDHTRTRSSFPDRAGSCTGAVPCRKVHPCP
jgi:tetratricopeptide (TPR) repeat protein